MKLLVILRGVSGSGKSTRAKLLAGSVENSIICSADDWFVVDGVYRFDPKALKTAHTHCLLTAEWAMKRSYNQIIIDNTNTKQWEFKPYLDLAVQYEYEVKIETVGSLYPVALQMYASRNIHGLTLEQIQRQAERFEKV